MVEVKAGGLVFYVLDNGIQKLFSQGYGTIEPGDKILIQEEIPADIPDIRHAAERKIHLQSQVLDAFRIFLRRHEESLY